jgi:SNF2 family DNA or RNA helicase
VILRDWQEREAADHHDTPKRAMLCEPRTGKTLACIESLKRSKFASSSILIIAPVSFASSWADQVADALGCEVLRGYGQPTAKLYVQLKLARQAGKRIVCVLTYGQIWRSTTACRFKEELRKWKWPALIIDELHRIASPSSRQARVARLLSWDAQWVRGLTGTPVPAHYGNLWGQMAAINPEVWGESFGAFARRELILDPMYPSRVIGVRDEARLLRMVAEDSCVVRRNEVFGADQWEYVTREIELPKPARALYSKLAKDWIAENDGKAVVADHALTRLVRFQQITSGFIADSTGGLHEIQRAKIDAVLDDLSEIKAQGEKVVLFHRFKWEHSAYVTALGKVSGMALFAIDGSTKAEDRVGIAEKFNKHRGPAVVVAQIQAASEALSFAEAQHVFFVSTNFSLKDNLQARDRVFKPGQCRVVTNFIVKKSVDEFIHRKIGEKKPMHDAVMGGTLEEMLGV